MIKFIIVIGLLGIVYLMCGAIFFMFFISYDDFKARTSEAKSFAILSLVWPVALVLGLLALGLSKLGKSIRNGFQEWKNR